MTTAPEFNALFWGTMGPVTLLLGGQIKQIRARGTYSVRVIDAAQFSAQVGSADDLPARGRSIVVQRFTDMLGALSAGTTTPEQLAAQAQTLAATLQSQVEPDFNALGLAVTGLGIEAIEEM